MSLAPQRVRYLALLTTVAATASLLNPAVSPTAHAGPDDGKVIGTREHIDAPKTYWTGNTFELRAKDATPLDDAVLWVGKGYSGSDGSPQYQYILPDNGTMNDIGKPGEIYYAAPRTPSWNQDPIWWGYGADSDLPLEQFQNGSASMDLLGVEGPGDVEFFADLGEAAGPERLLGTTPGAPKSVKLHKGLHVHISTLFTKPGRYVLTYRSTARALDGTLIASQPQHLAVQVGGRSPLETPTPSLRERYDAAPAGNAADVQGNTLAIAPTGKENLSTITFDTPSKANGTVTLLNDGYFLTDLPVKDGHAEWEEMLGPRSGSLQAVFTPEGAGARWISAPLAYAAGGSASTSESATAWTDNTGTTRTLQSTDEVTPADTTVRTRLEKVSDDVIKLTVDADPLFSGFLEGGLYDTPQDTAATQDIQLNVHEGHGEALIPYSSWMNGSTVRFNITPLATVRTGAAQLPLSEKLDLSSPLEATANLGTGAPAPSPSAAPDPQAERCENRVVLSMGHVDIKATQKGNAFEVALKDETGQHERRAVDRRLEDVVLAVGDNARRPRTKDLAGADFDYLGPLNTKYYLLPQTQNQYVIWPGYNTQELDYSQFKDGVHLNITPKNIPDGAAYGLYIDEGLDGKTSLINSTTGQTSIKTTFASHTHTSWAFTKPGIYDLEVSYSATTKDGTTVASQPQVLRFAIGKEATEHCANSTAASASDAAPAPSSTPSDAARPQGIGSSAAPGSPAGHWWWIAPLLSFLATYAFGLSWWRDHTLRDTLGKLGIRLP